VISLIIPLRDGPKEWWKNVFPVAGEFDVVVVDGGSTAAEAPPFSARILSLPGLSRGARLGFGAREARGDVLFFLHGDTRPPADARRRIESAVAAGASGGCFLLRYEAATPALARVARWANRRTRWAKLPFGDQGIFCTRDAYARIGGFHDLPICDDLDFVRRLRRLPGFVVVPSACATSPARYGRPVRRVLLDAAVLGGYFAGVRAETLERWYRKKT